MRDLARPRRAPLILVGLPVAVALVSGVASGLARLGLDVPGATRLLAVNHGALMVSGVVGTVIGLERAAAAGHLAALAAPMLSAAGALALVAGADEAAPLLFVTSAAATLLVFAAFLRRQFALPTAVMTVGVGAWLAGNLAWLVEGWRPGLVVPWWMAFLALTIAGERLELARFRPQGPATRAALWAAIGLLLAGPVLVLAEASRAGFVLVGAGAAVLALWLLANDSARRTAGRGGTATYAGVALIGAYGWLGLSGLAMATWGLEAGTRTDTVLHMFFLGFVFGAIFAHAPIILPAVTGLSLRFTPLFWAGLGVLHASLAIRVGANLGEDLAWRQTGGSLNALAIALLGAAIAIGLLIGRRAQTDGR